MKYCHLIETTENTNKIVIYRVFSDGTKDLYTEIDMPQISLADNRAEFDEFCTTIGQMLIADSPIARKKFKI